MAIRAPDGANKTRHGHMDFLNKLTKDLRAVFDIIGNLLDSAIHISTFALTKVASLRPDIHH